MAAAEFNKLWHLTPQSKTQLKAGIKDYLFNSVLTHGAIVLDGREHGDRTCGWQRQKYEAGLGRMLRPWGSTCRIVDRVYWVVPNEMRLTRTAYKILVSSLELPTIIQKRLQTCQANKKKRFAIVFVSLSWRINGRSAGAHATLLFFDLQNKLQYFFDPDDGHDSPSSNSIAFSSKVFLPGFQVVPASANNMAVKAESIQQVFQRDNQHQAGVCGLMCVLIALICSRFNYYCPGKIVEILKEYTARERALIGTQLVGLYQDHIQAVQPTRNKQRSPFETDRKRVDYVQLYNVLFGTWSGTKCLAYSTTTHRLCKRKPCLGPDSKNTQYCWQHKKILLFPMQSCQKCNVDNKLTHRTIEGDLHQEELKFDEDH